MQGCIHSFFSSFASALIVRELDVIGRKERVNFPGLQLKGVVVKIDSGAYTSSIHCSKIIREDGNKVSCVFLEPGTPGYTGEMLSFDIEREVIVKSSNGTGEKRSMIRTRIELFGKEYEIYLTLTNRNDMRYPVLLGRRFLKGKFLIDVGRKFCDK